LTPVHRSHHRWRSRHLNRDMDVLIFGHAGQPFIVFPTSMGSFYEFEDRGMVTAIADKIDAGAVQLFCATTVDTESFYARGLPPRVRIDRYLTYERFLMDEMLSFVRSANDADTLGVTGCSFGAYHALTMALRHPDRFTTCITMGGAFDITRFMDGYYDPDVYLLCPPHFLPQMGDPWYLDRYRRNKWVLVTGEEDGCKPDTEYAAKLLSDKGIPVSCHVWGHGSIHDWPEWRKMAAAYIP
jgi:esterase/lipase superfamily enzyme